MDRNARAKIIWCAEKLDRATKPPNSHYGALGLTGLAILRLLLFRFGGKPEPSYKQIKRETGFAFSTISEALKRLEIARVVTITRRKVRTRHGNRQMNNCYSFPGLVEIPLIPPVARQVNPVLNLGFLPSIANPVPSGPFVPWEEWDSPLKDALDSLGKAIRERENTEGSVAA